MMLDIFLMSMIKISKSKQMMNKKKNKRKNIAIWTLQATKVHQEEENIHHRAEEEVKTLKQQGGHHAKLNYEKGIKIIL
jgi:hypothetical protein